MYHVPLSPDEEQSLAAALYTDILYSLELTNKRIPTETMCDDFARQQTTPQIRGVIIENSSQAVGSFLCIETNCPPKETLGIS